MAGFARKQGALFCDDVAVEEIARETGTPVHVYSGAAIDDRYRALDAAFAGYPHRLHYALKANSTLAIASRLAALGAGADANSGGELEVALRTGFAPADIVFTGVGKSRAELERVVGAWRRRHQHRVAGRGRPHRRHRAGTRRPGPRRGAREPRHRRR